MRNLSKLSKTQLIKETLDMYVRASLDDPVAEKDLQKLYDECVKRGVDYFTIVQYGIMLSDSIIEARKELKTCRELDV